MRIYLLIFITFLMAPLAQANMALLKQGVKYYQQGNFMAAATVFHKLTNTPNIGADLADQSNFYLGLSLYNLKLYQAASYPMMKAIRDDSKKYKQRAMEKLISISNRLGDQHILDYVMAKMQITDLQKLAIDVYYYKLASVSYEKGLLDQAVQYLKLSVEKNPNNEPALNLLGLSYLKKNDTQNAIDTYQKLLGLYAKYGNNYSKKGYTTLNLARAYYQNKDFETDAEYYRGISKDNSAYRESLTELGWSYLQIGKVRSALSVIQTLHTPFYENYFEPESLVLRAILLNYLCQFDEAEKAVKSFNENYENTLDILSNWTSETITVADAIAEINFATEILKSDKQNASAMNNYRGKIPFKVTRSILKDYRMKGLYDTYIMIRDESKIAKKYFGSVNTQLNPFLDKIYAGRLNYFKNQLALKFNQVIVAQEKNIMYYNQQIKFVNYEILEAKKSQLRLKISSADKPVVNDEENRNYYIKNGYRYWPFQGEFWIDEIGNYQYLGANHCEQE
ncbi:MAG: tetratricopeptide repeat protein [Pseudobdellovibrio sp.]